MDENDRWEEPRKDGIDLSQMTTSQQRTFWEKEVKRRHELFEEEDIEGIAECLGESWKNKKKISPLVSTPAVNKMYKSLEEDGMIGGKLLGTGGSGFIFGILNEDTDVFKIKEKYKSHYIDIDISEKGSVIINE